MKKKVQTAQMVNNSTNINKLNNHLSPQIVKHKKYPNICKWKSRSWIATGTKMG